MYCPHCMTDNHNGERYCHNCGKDIYEQNGELPKQARGISRRHLSFQIVDNNWTVRDLGSMNGSFVSGGVRLSPFTDWKLEDGDIIWLGEKENSLIVHL